MTWLKNYKRQVLIYHELLILLILPRYSTTIERKKHIVIAPVKLARATNDEHKSHPDGEFCTASIRAIESLASMLGPAQVFFLSQDDKARIPISNTAVQNRAPFLHPWNIECSYQITIGARQKNIN